MTGHLRIVSLAAPAMVQDGGRRGVMSHGVPPGGAVHAGLLAQANRAVENPPDAAAIEAYGPLAVTVVGAAARLAWNGEPHVVRAGETMTLPPPGVWRVRYLAVRGGIDVAVVLSGRGTLVAGHFGGLDGRWLRKGDALSIGDLRSVPFEGAAVDVGDPLAPIRIVPGPDVSSFARDAIERFCDAGYIVSPLSDRVGTRLLGRAIVRLDDDAARSRPMMRGFVQVPRDGAPVVLGPDHPTTGGYPVLAQVIRADASRLAALRPGAPVRFVPTTLREARDAWHAQRTLSGGP